jgi:predicted DNA-binding transcriptional regulator AlpA
VTEEKILSLADLYKIFGRGMTKRSFPNWIVKVKREEGFPSQIVLSKRSTGWRWSEVNAWMESRQRSDASRSPRNMKKTRLTVDERVAMARELCRPKRTSLREGLDFLRRK